MTAGRGIVHSERTPPSAARDGGKLSGIQAWVALPRGTRRPSRPSPTTAGDALPVVDGRAAYRLRLIAGAASALRAPVDGVLRHVLRRRGAAGRRRLPLPDRSRGARGLRRWAAVELAGDRFEPGQLLVFRAGRRDRDLRAERCRPPDAARRRADGRSAPHLVELRLELARSASSRPRPTGRPGASRRCRTKPSSSRCPRIRRACACDSRPYRNAPSGMRGML